MTWLSRRSPKIFSANSTATEPTEVEPRWMLVDVRAVKKTRLIGLPELRQHAELEEMVLLKKGNRLSVMPVTPVQWDYIVKKLLNKKA